MKFKGNKLLTALIVLLMAAALLSSVALAESEAAPAADVDGSKVADPTKLDKNNRETTVTLKLPSGESKYVYDIVFVMDSSSSTKNNNIDFSDCVADLLDSVKDKNITLNVGVIKVRGRVFDTISMVTDEDQSGMIEYSEANKQTITDAIDVTETALKALSSGTNIHGGLDLANEWLSADEEVPDEHKFVFLLTDGKTYIWNDEKDVPTSVYGQYMVKNVVYKKPAVGQQTIAYSKSAYKFVDNVNFFSATADELASLTFDEYFEKTGNFYANDFAKLYASTNEELSQPTKYDYRCGYAYNESSTADGTVDEHDLTNANYTYNLHKKYYEFVPAPSFADLKWLQANPYTIAVNDDGSYVVNEAGYYSYTTTVNPDFYQLHPDGLQKALYLTGHLWTDMVAKYNGIAIVYNGWGSGSGLEIAKSFNDWIKSDGISDYAADFSSVDSVNNVFNSVKEDIIYMVASGVVTDKIADDFTLKNADNENGFWMKLDGEALARTYDADGKWNFGTPIVDETTEKYPYVVEYNDDTKTITWTINVPVENTKPVTLSYTLILDEDAESGEYDTNDSAVLAYVTTDGEDGTYEFKKPVVTYSEPAGGGSSNDDDDDDDYVPEDLNGDDHYAYIVGYPDGMVHPNANITRAEVAAIFFRLLKEEVRDANLTSSNSFSDVAEGQWFNTSISTMAKLGIVTGYPDGSFKPNDNITRAEFATIAARFDKDAKDSASIFSDIDGHWAKEYIERAAKKGWITGYPDGTFRPDRLITRAEAASLINRVLIRDPEKPEDLLKDMIKWPDNMDTNAWYYIDIQEATNTHEYERKTKPTETWIELLKNPDWSKYNY